MVGFTGECFALCSFGETRRVVNDRQTRSAIDDAVVVEQRVERGLPH